jgi:hypothetical protein
MRCNLCTFHNFLPVQNAYRLQFCQKCVCCIARSLINDTIQNIPLCIEGLLILSPTAQPLNYLPGHFHLVV